VSTVVPGSRPPSVTSTASVREAPEEFFNLIYGWRGAATHLVFMSAEEAQHETVAGVSPGAGGAETEIVPPVTEAAPEHAWSQEEPETEVLGQSWRSTWGVATVIMVCAAVTALVIGFTVWIVGSHHTDAPAVPSAAPSAPVLPSVLPSVIPPSAAPSASPTPVAAAPDDDEFVALAISPGSVGRTAQSGYGTSGTQAHANEIALSECRAIGESQDCVLVGAGMFHGCVAFAYEGPHWVAGTGSSADAARSAALAKLGNPNAASGVQCSNPPGLIKPAPAAVTVTQEAPPTTVMVQAPSASLDDQFIAALRRASINVYNPAAAIATAHQACAALDGGAHPLDVAAYIKDHGDVTALGATSFVANAIIFYCPQHTN
jgi:hypothetical protein